MFGLGMWEIVLIAVVALLALGPDKLPQAAKTLSKGIRDFRKSTRELQDTLEDDHEIGDAIRDLKSALRGEDPSPQMQWRQRERERQAEAARKAAASSSKIEDSPGETSAKDEESDNAESGLPAIKPAVSSVAQGDLDEKSDDSSNSNTDKNNDEQAGTSDKPKREEAHG